MSVGHAIRVSVHEREHDAEASVLAIHVPMEIASTIELGGTSSGSVEVGVDAMRQRLAIRADSRQGFSRRWRRWRNQIVIRVGASELPWLFLANGMAIHGRRWWLEGEWLVFDLSS